MTDKKEHILKVAEELFADHGFEGASVRMLANKAGVNIAMISYYFGSKEKLFEALVESRTLFTHEKLQALNEEYTDPWDKINAAIDIYVDRILGNHKFHRIFFREISLGQRGVGEDIIQMILKNANVLKDIIAEGEKKGLFRKVDIPLTVSSILGNISQFALSDNLSLRMMGGKPDKESVSDEKNKNRLKEHLKDLIYHHLKISNK